MFKSYFKIAIRNLSRNKLTSFINIFGLGLSMSVGLMIMIRLQDELNYDKFHPSASRSFRINSEYAKQHEGKWKMASTPLPLAGALKENDAIKAVVNIYPALHGKAIAAGKEMYLDAAFTRPEFFSVFGFSLATGNPSTALERPNSIIIGKQTAIKYFGSYQVAMGKTIMMEDATGYIITGILNDAPGKSHLRFDAYASFSTVAGLEKNNVLGNKSTDWFAFNSSYTYVQLNKGVKKSTLQQMLNGIAEDLNRENKIAIVAFYPQALNNITPGKEYLVNEMSGGTSWTKIYIEAGLALLILLAACFNYTNLTIARALTRAKEVGIRKIAGAKRSQLFAQYIFESVILSIISLVFAWLILSLIVRYAPFNDDYEFIPSSFQYNITYVAWSLLYAIFTGFLAGSSPAWILSAFKPLRVLKNLSTAKIMGKLGLQKSLIVFQYSLSLVLIIFLFVFYRQFSFMANADPGFKKENTMVVSLSGINEKLAIQKIIALNGVKEVAASSASFSKHFNGMNAPLWRNNKTESIGINYYYADEKFVPMLQLRLIAGDNFPGTTASDKEKFIMLNEKAALALGYQDAYKAVGEKLWVNDTLSLVITAVLKDFIYENAGKPIRPLVLRNKKGSYDKLFVQIENTNKKLMEKRVGNALAGLSAGPLSYSWLDDEVENSNSQTATISLLGFLGFIALAIATLGLLGLVVYTVEVKGKEIGIRKVIGASERQLVHILSRGFIKLLIIAGLIAMPLGWLLATMFLQNFSMRIHFGFVNVITCFMFLLGIGLFTIITQTYKAATANPVKALRTE